MKNIKSYTFLLIALTILFLSGGCARKLSMNFYESESDILFQRSCTYYHNGYVSNSDERYAGVLAVVKNRLIFEPIGPGSEKHMKSLKPIVMTKDYIDSISIDSNLKTIRTKIITVHTYKKDYYYHVTKHAETYRLMKSWLKDD